MCQHLGILALTGKKVKSDDYSVIKEHLLFCNHSHDFENFSIHTTNIKNFKVTLMKSLLINRDHPPLNKISNLYVWNFLVVKEHNFIIG